MIDIHSKGDFPSDALSNFEAYSFIVDGVNCASMEAFLQSLKFRNPEHQKIICLLTGKTANLSPGRLRNFLWKFTQKLHWQGKTYRRNSDEYLMLITHAYDALSENTEFRDAPQATANEKLCHSIGGHDNRKTVLTEDEFIRQLYRLRDILSKGEKYERIN